MALAAPGPRLTGLLLVGSAVVVTVAFAGLGSAFDYPDVLGRPAEQVLVAFGAQAWLVGSLFTLLALGAAMLAPIALGTARLAGPSRWSTAAAATGVAAALMQVVGLARWPLLVPSLAATVADPTSSAVDRASATEQFTWLNTVLGQGLGETCGYLLTAAWTLLVLLALRRRARVPRVFAVVGVVSAVMILAGLLVPLGVPGADTTNFAGFLLWSAWIVWFGVLLLRGAFRAPAAPAPDPTAQPLPA
ncbi:DUF4386 family protein [Actinomycetospora sp. CA-101289]|uniref:DUF4386 family protein n=1 Tax=Actinomycetospora sp. CA-101289 TaxID=3239893 RepID=UPI003D98B1AF